MAGWIAAAISSWPDSGRRPHPTGENTRTAKKNPGGAGGAGRSPRPNKKKKWGGKGAAGRTQVGWVGPPNKKKMRGEGAGADGWPAPLETTIKTHDSSNYTL